MREILFRGQSAGNLKPWIYGYYHFDKNTNTHYICDKDSLYRFEVIPETVGQYIGLKYEGGNLMFEGDIIADGIGNLAPIVWIEDWCEFVVDYPDEPQEAGLWCKFISTIHDNPELIK